MVRNPCGLLYVTYVTERGSDCNLKLQPSESFGRCYQGIQVKSNSASAKYFE